MTGQPSPADATLHPQANWWKLPLILLMGPLVFVLIMIGLTNPPRSLVLLLWAPIVAPFALPLVLLPGLAAAGTFLVLRRVTGEFSAFAATLLISFLGFYTFFEPYSGGSSAGDRRGAAAVLAMIAQYPAFICILAVHRAFPPANRKSS
ncbi:hypothetical protein HMPREF9946_01300 [Acetobacteraceae bacterium AT-5844]|nr:hypothetical protein HMPREF9946_01300 [Acetobacteraceae bacterium AT-5844]